MKTDSGVTKSNVVLLAIALGFCGGLLASLFIFGLNKFPSSVIEQGHPLLSAPFLTFIGIMIVISVFYRPIQSLLSRGQIKIKWGDKEISLSEIEDEIDAEFNEYASKLADLDIEIQELTLGAIQKAEKSDGEKVELTAILASVAKKIKDTFDWINSVELATLVYHLATSKFRWRNQHTLVKKTGMTANTIDDFVRAFPEHIIRSQGKSGNIIYRLSDKTKAKYIDNIEFGQ